MRHLLCFLLSCFPLSAAAQPAPALRAPLAITHPSNVGDARPTNARFADIDRIVQQAIAEHAIPGAVVLIEHDRRIVYRKAFGERALWSGTAAKPVADREPMTTDTIFDLASLTKCIATTTAMMQLIETGRVKLNDPVAAYLPAFAQNGKDQITVRELMTHYSGLPPDIDLSHPWMGRDAAWKLVMESTPIHPPGSSFLYSDINFETLGFLVEAVTGESLANYAQAHIFTPLGMTHTRFLPPASWRSQIAPTQWDNDTIANGSTVGQMLRGIVHDPTARRMGGVAGHAGVFSTADDLALFAEDVMHTHHILSASAVAKMSTPQQPANASSLRGLGWDIDSPFASNRGDLLPVGSFGHTGFTGTSLWMDPVTDTAIILLTSAVHPDGHPEHAGTSIISLRTRLATAVVHSLELTTTEQQALALSRITGYNDTLMAARRIADRNGHVRTGIDVLEADKLELLHPNPAHPVRIGLITNQTAVNLQGRRTADVLAHVPGLKLAAIFSPEHGFEGRLDTTSIGNSTDAATGAPIFSVYGATNAARRPTAQELATVDALVFDIQDAGVRYYTYETTLGYFLEAAAQTHKPIFVLDRPNPLTGSIVQGPVSDPGSESFVNYTSLPVRHGMTMGELAGFDNATRGIHADLTVVAMQGWMRGDWYDSTSLLWIHPSPNLRSLTEATLYPGIGLIEGSNISVGRGTDTPFEVLGAPWIDPALLSATLNARALSGIRFIPIRFTPTDAKYKGESCGGVQMIVTDRASLDAPEVGLEIAAALHRLYPQQYKLEAIDTLLRSRTTLQRLKNGEDPRRIAEDWQDTIAVYLKQRKPYLLY
jgi:uncharacterized protein YbbC (DUF1343 family)/CubicO group peptidase (beta-lactamase class C family)